MKLDCFSADACGAEATCQRAGKRAAADGECFFQSSFYLYLPLLPILSAVMRKHRLHLYNMFFHIQ